MKQDKIRLVLTTALNSDSVIGDHVKKHGDGVKVLALMVDDAEDAWKIQPEDIGELVADLLKMNPRTLPSKIEVRPSKPGK